MPAPPVGPNKLFPANGAAELYAERGVSFLGVVFTLKRYESIKTRCITL